MSIPKIIQQIKNINEDKNSHQKNLFDEQDAKEEDFDFLPHEPWKQKELLSEEFKSLGFFLSDHPLNEYEEVFNQLKMLDLKQYQTL